ncbi:MAG: hypothetical protein P1P83_09275, partial [Bacteroidales bacterium]|nr:hypothetical protein [Bacteroidales bacterium]
SNQILLLDQVTDLKAPPNAWIYFEERIWFDFKLNVKHISLQSSSIYDPKTVNFLQKLAQNWRERKNHLPEIRVSG